MPDTLIWVAATIGGLALAYVGLVVLGVWLWSLNGRRLVSALAATTLPRAATRFFAADVSGLPEPARRYLCLALPEGQPILRSASLSMQGRFNMSLSSERWKPFTSEQHVTTNRPGFVWDARITVFPGLPVRVTDSYIGGQGRLCPALLGLFPVGEVMGGGDFAKAELMRWFAEAVWYPTALLPSEGVTWTAVDATSAQATMTDGPLTLTLLFRFGADGLVSSIHADARSATVNGATVMLPWECRLSNYRAQDGIVVPMTGEVLYLTEQGERSYFLGKVTRISFVINP